MAREFTVTVDGAFDEAGVWVIETEVMFAEGLDATQRERLVGEIRLALLRGIIEQGVRGRALNATQVRVVLDDPGREFFPNGLPSILH